MYHFKGFQWIAHTCIGLGDLRSIIHGQHRQDEEERLWHTCEYTRIIQIFKFVFATYDLMKEMSIFWRVSL